MRFNSASVGGVSADKEVEDVSSFPDRNRNLDLHYRW